MLKFRKIIQYFIENWKENSFLMKSWRRTHILLKSGSRIQFSLKSRRRIKLCNIISEIFPLARSKLFVCMTVTLFLKPKKKKYFDGKLWKGIANENQNSDLLKSHDLFVPSPSINIGSDFRGNRSLLIYFNLLNIKSEIWRLFRGLCNIF